MKSYFPVLFNASKKSLPALLALGMLLSGCQKDQDEPQPEPLSAEETVALVGGGLYLSSEGLAAEAVDAALLAERYSEKSGGGGPCGQTFDSTVVRSFSNAFITADYQSVWTWTVNCDNRSVPVSINFGRLTTGEYETSRMSSSDAAGSHWTIGNLITGADYLLNGRYERSGSQRSKVGNRNELATKIVFEVEDLSVSKEDRSITGGQSAFVLTGATSGGRSFRSEGGIAFHGNGAATLTVNGNTYEIDLEP